MLIFKEIQLLPEIFLGISIIYLTVYGTFLAVNRKYLLIHNSVLYLSVLIISMFCFLLVNNALECSSIQIFNNTIVIDYLSFSSKFWIATMSIFCFLMVERYVAVQKINYFEYSVLILFALLDYFFYTFSKWYNYGLLINWVTKLIFLYNGDYEKRFSFLCWCWFKIFYFRSLFF